MHQSMSFSDWQKSGGAKDYNTFPEIGCVVLADEEGGQASCLTDPNYHWSAAATDEVLAQAGGTSVSFGIFCV